LLSLVSEAIAKLRHAGLWSSDDITQVLRAQMVRDILKNLGQPVALELNLRHEIESVHCQ
jgi:hypothetical protein